MGELSKEVMNNISSEDIKVETVNDKVLVSVNTDNKTSEEVSKLVKEALDSVEIAREKTGATDTDVLIGGINKNLKSMASATIENKSLKDQVAQLENKNSKNNIDNQTR